MNSVASTLNRVTGMEFNNQISVLTPNNWNTWKHDMQFRFENLITETTDGVAAWKILKDHFEPVTKARVIQLLDQFFGTKYQPGEDVGIFISRVKTAATRLQEAGHKLDDLYIGFQLIRWLPQEFQSTVQQIYRWKEEDFRVVKIEAELILEANRLQLMKQDLEKAENAYLSSFTSKKSKTLPGATAAAHGDPNGKNDYQKKSEFNINLRFCEAECSLLELDKQLVTSCILFEENSDKGVWVIDTAATSHFCNHKSLFLDLKPITNMKMSLATEDKSCPVEGIGTLRFRVKYKGSFHEITLTDVLFNPKLRRNLLSGSRLESKGAHFVGTKDLSEQQEALMVEVTIPNCYKQAIRSRDASKWHDAMDKEINIQGARLVARGNTQLRSESLDEVFQEYKLELSKVKSLKLRCYSDSDFAINRDDRVSMGGFITFIDETPISSRTFKQKSVSLSTMEAEYVSLTEAAKEFIWLKNVIGNKSLNLELSENVMFCDNQAAISVSKSPVENYRTKHIDVRYHFLRNLIYDKGLKEGRFDLGTFRSVHTSTSSTTPKRTSSRDTVPPLKGVVHFAWPGSPMKEGMIRSEHLSFRTQVLYRPRQKRSSSCDVWYEFYIDITATDDRWGLHLGWDPGPQEILRRLWL
ncbi:retrovirus-related Pol polyprotein from transposon TNT 1-94 [Trichonephila clavipes]|nr:retrovirus-related Pol polyprotein from transposon TNT 1-94 [Trichonephila clavipes]